MTSELQHSSTSRLPDSKAGVIKRLYILAAVLALGFSSIWLLPKAGDMKLSRLARNLPERFDSMYGKKKEVTGEELKILAKDTEFERIEYFDLENPKRPPVVVSVVFSGKDINNSIHRPERCSEVIVSLGVWERYDVEGGCASLNEPAAWLKS